MLNLLKGKLLAAGAVVITILLGLVKIFASKAKREAQKADRLKAALEFRDDVEDLDTELSSDLQVRKDTIRKEIEDDEEVTSLSTPNDW